MGNNALKLNPPTGVDLHITSHGSDFYFAICAVMGFSAFVVAGLAMRRPYDQRHFHYISIALLATAAVAYYSMGSDLGWAAINVEFLRSAANLRGTNRQVFYARYIDWVVTTPLLLMDILLTSALPWSTILFTIFMDLIMIISGLLGALTQSRYKFGYFVLGCVAMFVVFYEILWVGRRNAAVLGDDVSRLYLQISLWTIFLWTTYPIIWGVAEGGNVITSDSEAVAYGVLDFLAKPIFTAVLLFGHRNIDTARFRLEGKVPLQWTNIEKDVAHRESQPSTIGQNST